MSAAGKKERTLSKHRNKPKCVCCGKKARITKHYGGIPTLYCLTCLETESPDHYDLYQYERKCSKWGCAATRHMYGVPAKHAEAARGLCKEHYLAAVSAAE